MFVNLFVMTWVARYLGPKQFGIWNYALAFVGVFSSFVSFGLTGIVVRNIVRDPACKDKTLGSVFMLRVFGGILNLMLTIGVISIMHPDDNLTRWLVGIIAVGVIFQSFDTIDLWFQSQVQSKYSIYANIVAFLIISIVKVILIINKASLISFACASCFEIVIGAIALIIFYQKNGDSIKTWIYSLTHAKTLLNESWPIIISSISVLTHGYIDQIMLGEMIGASELGQYSAALRIIAIFGFVPTLLVSSLAPAITKAKLNGEDLYYLRLVNLYRLMFFCFLFVSVPIFFFSSYLVGIVYGSAYKESGMLLSLMATRLFFTNFGVARSLFITNDNLFKYALVSSVAGLLVNISVNYFLIQIFASKGSILASIISYSVQIFIIDIFYIKTRKNVRSMFKAMVTPWKIQLA
jgi:O-antigen/teichoic acid export membrane protein